MSRPTPHDTVARSPFSVHLMCGGETRKRQFVYQVIRQIRGLAPVKKRKLTRSMAMKPNRSDSSARCRCSAGRDVNQRSNNAKRWWR